MIFSIIWFIIFYLFRLFGYEFWILPEIFENDSFIPYYTFKKKNDKGCWLIIWVAMILLTIAYLVFLFFVPSSYEGLSDLLLESYDEVVIWGKEKVAFNFTKDISNKTLTYEKLLSDEEDLEFDIND